MTDLEKASQFKGLGNEAFKAKKYEEAIEYFTKAIECNPNDHVFYSNRSGSYLNKGDYEEALKDAEQCVKMNSAWPRGYQRKGSALFYMDKIDDAIAAYKQGLTQDPTNAGLIDDLKAAEAKKTAPPPEMNQQYLQNFMKLMQHPEGQELMKDPSFMQTLQTCLQNPQMLPLLAEKDPRIKKIMEILADTSAPANNDFENLMKNMGGQNFKEEPMKPEQEQPKKSEKKQETKMDIEDPAEDLKNKGNAQFKKKNFAGALQYYDQAIKEKPEQPLYYSNKAAVYIEMKDFEKAAEEVAKAEKLFEDGLVKDFVKKGKVLARKASILEKQGHLAEAIQAYDKSLIEDINPRVKDEMNRLKKLQKENEAKSYINPELADQHCEKGNSFFKQGKFPEAVKQYEEAIRRNPEVAKYYSNLGTVYIKLMEFQSARDYFQKAIKKDPEYVKAYPKKGDCHFFLKEYHKALETYELGLKKDPENELCKQGVVKTQNAIYTSSTQEDQETRAKRAMADPEIQAILQTPEVRNALAELERDPKSVQKIMQNKSLAAKIDKLIQAGVLRMG